MCIRDRMWCNTIIHHCIIIVDWLIKHRENMNKTHNLYSNCHENQILVFDMRVQKVITANQPSQPSRIQNVGTEWNPGHNDRSLWHFTTHFITPEFWWTTSHRNSILSYFFLFQAYYRCNSKEAAARLLQDIVVCTS